VTKDRTPTEFVTILGEVVSTSSTSRWFAVGGRLSVSGLDKLDQPEVRLDEPVGLGDWGSAGWWDP
jgi:hypothetical protein